MSSYVCGQYCIILDSLPSTVEWENLSNELVLLQQRHQDLLCEVSLNQQQDTLNEDQITLQDINGTFIFLCLVGYFEKLDSLTEMELSSSTLSCAVPPEMKEWNNIYDASYYQKCISDLEEEKNTLLIEIDCFKKALKLSNDKKGKQSLINTLQEEIVTLKRENKVS